jgi:PIN domain nuclease of toxin-antitoxin system
MGAIEAATAADGAVLSAITPWEVSMLVAKGRLVLPRGTREWLEAHILRPGFMLHPLSIAVAAASNSLPPGLHGDPADRIIVATARELGVPLITADRTILTYAGMGHVQAIDATA